MDQKALGDFGEKIAADYLKRKGYRILDRNYCPRFVSGPQRAEIDIVAKKDNVISFIEVKTLKQLNGFSCSAISPEEKVDYLKQKKLIRAAENWLTEKKISLEKPWQIDVVAVLADFEAKKAKIQHFKNAVA